MPLTKERKGEIALLVLKHVIAERGLPLRPANTIKEIREKAKELGIPGEQAVQFAEELIREVVDEAFSKK